MKKLVFLMIAAFMLTSCATYEMSQCPSYGNQNKMTKYGYRAQVKYNKRRI